MLYYTQAALSRNTAAAMWLHDTITSELHYFNAPEDVPGGYTILSHVWSGTGEQTFREVQEIWAEYKKGTKLRLDSEKISEGNGMLDIM